MKKAKMIFKNYNDDIKAAFSKNLCSLLGEYRKKDVASYMGVTERQIDKYEKEEAVPGLLPILNLSNNLNVPVEKLISDNKELNFNMYLLITQLGIMLNELNVSIDEAEQNICNASTVHLKINDQQLSQILLMLCFDKQRLDSSMYYNRVNELAWRYSSMLIYDKQLKNYTDFMDLARHEYIYQTANGLVFKGIDENDNHCIGVDLYTLEEMEELDKEWDDFNDKQKIKWVELSKEQKNKVLNMTLDEKKKFLSGYINY